MQSNKEMLMKDKFMPYKLFLLMMVISFLIMYGVMFLNVDEASHIYLSLTRMYMALLMVTPMAVIMLVLMKKMYPIKKLNLAIILGSSTLFVLTLFLLRTQTFVGNIQYMKAMIPHHSSAILTSKHASIQDPEVKRLSEEIIKSQKEEITKMKAMLDRLEK